MGSSSALFVRRYRKRIEVVVTVALFVGVAWYVMGVETSGGFPRLVASFTTGVTIDGMRLHTEFGGTGIVVKGYGITGNIAVEGYDGKIDHGRLEAHGWRRYDVSPGNYWFVWGPCPNSSREVEPELQLQVWPDTHLLVQSIDPQNVYMAENACASQGGAFGFP